MLIYDVEVLYGPDEVEGGWNNPEGMKFGTAVVYDSIDDLYHFYGPSDLEKLRAHLSLEPRAGFNNVKFDDLVIFGNDYVQPGYDLGKDHLRFTETWCVMDLLIRVVAAKFGVRTVSEAEQKYGSAEVHDGTIGLNSLAMSTIGKAKTGYGAKAPLLIREGKWADVFAYNLNDVRITWKLIEFVNKFGFVVDRKGNVIRIKSFSFDERSSRGDGDEEI